jgi:AcrR family transcriptional regulator
MDEQLENLPACPRPYRLGKRQEAQELSRERILDGAREALLDREASTFTMEAVARRAGVSRQTVYNLYGNKGALLLALLARSARGSAVADLPRAFQHPDPLEGLLELIRIFARFWVDGAELTRRIRGLAALDSELGEAMRTLQERRLGGIRGLVARIQAAYDRPVASEAAPTLFMLTGFECYDTLRQNGVAEEDIPDLLIRLARAALKLD